MECAKEEFLNIGDSKNKKKSKMIFFEKHKILSLMVTSASLLIGINIVLIYMFFYILHTL